MRDKFHCKLPHFKLDTVLCMFISNYLSENFIDIVISIRKVSLRNYTMREFIKNTSCHLGTCNLSRHHNSQESILVSKESKLIDH